MGRLGLVPLYFLDCACELFPYDGTGLVNPEL